MTYTRHPRVVLRVQEILDDLLLADGERSWPSRDPAKLSYHVREGIAAACKLPEFSKYAHLREKYIIRVKPNAVIAEPRVKLEFEGMKYASSKITLPEITTLEQAVGASAQHKIEELHLPNFPNDEEELAKLFRWTEQNQVYIINHVEAGITLTRKNPGELTWRPS